MKRRQLPLLTASSLPLPVVLDTEDFRAAWGDWIAHRNDLGKPLTDRSGRACLSTLERLAKQHSVEAAIVSINHCIGGGYQGLFSAPASVLNSLCKTPSTPVQKPRWEVENMLKDARKRLHELKFPGGCAFEATLSQSQMLVAEKIAAEIKTLKVKLKSYDDE